LQRRTFLAVSAIPMLTPRFLRAASRDEIVDALRARMREFTANGPCTGIVTLLQIGGKRIALDAFGTADLEAKRAMSTDTICQVMSMTKPFTGSGIALLAEEGKLRFTDSVERHLPEFRGQRVIESVDGKQQVTSPTPRPITIRDLMTHTSGMAELPPESAGDFFGAVLRRPLAENVLIYAQQPLLFAPGTRYQYSNMGLATLGRIIEVCSGQSYEKFLAERIFEPLGMKDSFFFPPAEKRERIAMVYYTKDGKTEPAAASVERKDARYPMPEGGLFSTAEDLSRFYQTVLDGGVYQGKRILSKWAVETMTALQESSVPGVAGTGNGWGLTWNRVSGPRGMLTLKSPTAFGHGGAFGTYGLIDPERKLVGVFLTQEAGRDVRTAQEGFIEQAEAAATA
jgi:CubicO group peptidase (beta-lactamase class C family)